MSFCRSHSRQKRICEEHKAELKEENFHLRSELQIEVDTNLCKQRRYYDAKAKRDNEIIRRQLAESRITNIIGDLHQYQINTQNQVNRMINNMARKQARIGVLVQEKFALQLLYQRNAHHLQRSRGDIGLLEFNRDRFYE
ncbi:hypothetical protein RIR_jg18594.t1 [Rhizophagus irregularis DAOM 181602=DAOM 197198]|nr:hypothetical protein RIR_jg18594.t1 [Rhizophagus irregularis DAOM 181602=DAOM 197198]